MVFNVGGFFPGRRQADLQNPEFRPIPSDVHGCMIPDGPEKALVPERPALMVYAAGSAFKGRIEIRAR